MPYCQDSPSSKEKLANIGPILDQDKNIGPILTNIDQYWSNIVATRSKEMVCRQSHSAP
jgi:hypothetical protein